MEFHGKLDEVRQKANAYISKGEMFVATAIQFKDIGATIRRFALEALEALEAKVREVIAKCVLPSACAANEQLVCVCCTCDLKLCPAPGVPGLTWSPS